MNYQQVQQVRMTRSRAIAAHGSLDKAISTGAISPILDATLSELLILGLLRQGVNIFFSVLGHGSTEIGEVLRVYQQAGLIKVFGLRSEIEASHAAAALRWALGKKSAVLTSIGPGALQALAASLVPASDGIGVWYLFGDETNEDEGFNMQQIPRHQQMQFPALLAAMGATYSLQNPWSLATALRRGLNTVDHPFRPGPFYLSLPMNMQSFFMPGYNLRELPHGQPPGIGAAQGDYETAANWIRSARSVLIKVGGGGRQAGREILQLAQLADAVCVLTPITSGAIPYDHPRCMGVGGSKGSICGNFAMENADLLIAIGTRAVCQSDSSRTGYPGVKRVININPSLDDALHYQDSLALVGDAASTLRHLINTLGSPSTSVSDPASDWFSACTQKKVAWEAIKKERFDHPCLEDPFWQRNVMTQPAAIKAAMDWAQDKDVLNFFDAGDVQANGFQVAEDHQPGKTFSESGASYMGFAVSALLATAAVPSAPYFLAFSGDGSFTMNPQALIDGVEHGARGCILLFDNNCMGAITGLQNDQYGQPFATWHRTPVNYLQWAGSVPGVLPLSGGFSPADLIEALDLSYAHPGISLVHVPVYFGPDPLGSLGVYGRWNVGNWVEETQALRHQIGL